MISDKNTGVECQQHLYVCTHRIDTGLILLPRMFCKQS